jgi:hypothetical protein
MRFVETFATLRFKFVHVFASGLRQHVVHPLPLAIPDGHFHHGDLVVACIDKRRRNVLFQAPRKVQRNKLGRVKRNPVHPVNGVIECSSNTMIMNDTPYRGAQRVRRFIDVSLHAQSNLSIRSKRAN